MVARYRGHEFQLPTDVDQWPLQLVAASCVVHDGRARIHRASLTAAVRSLLADQWERFNDAFPRSRDVVAASHVFAAAVGLQRPPVAGTGLAVDDLFDSLSVVFGALPRLLVILEQWPDKVESDLDRFWGLDYLDRWRFDADGRRRLTLRQINARLSNLPPQSALAVALGKRAPDVLVLMDVFEAITRRPHPSRPLTPAQLAERRTAEAQAKKEKDAAADYRRRHQTSGASLIGKAHENAQL